MCWINWFINSDLSKKDTTDLLNKMNKAINHRWPDDNWIFIDTCCANIIWLWHVRLSILDLSEGWHQPMSYLHWDNEYEIVFNWEIYNYLDIKDELAKDWYVFNNKTDTEVILASYDKWWVNCVKKFNGMWAFCIYDKWNNKLFCSRDRFWKKPFYYYWDWKTFVFSSEIKWILEFWVERKLNMDEVPKYLFYHYNTWKYTLIKNIYKLWSSSNIVFDLWNNTLKIETYWDMCNDNVIYDNYEKSVEILDELLNDSVKIRTTVSDVPVWTFLSWWLDSSLVTALFRKYYTWWDFYTFNVVWEDDIPNEWKYANLIAKHLWTNHHTVKVTWKDVLNNLKKLQYHYCDPIAEAGYIPNYFCSKYARKKVKVILTWDWWDEVFAWYSHYYFLQKCWYLWKVPWIRFIAKILSKIFPTCKLQKWFEFLSNATIKNYWEFLWLTLSNFSKKELNDLLTDKLPKWNNLFSDIKHTWKWFNSFLSQLQYTDIKILLSECFNIKPDKALMANWVEWRAPLEDYRLVEFAFNLDPNFKIKKWNEKCILKEVWKKYLPREIFSRKKQGYWTPVFEWINSDLREIVFDYLNNSVMLKAWYYNKNQIDYYLKNIKKKYLTTRIWNLFCLELFIKTYNLKF